MPSDVLHPRRCWFKANIAGCGPCEGPLQRAHLIRAQVIEREVDAEFETLWDPRCWVPGCERHHRMLDHSRQIRIPRETVPAAVFEYATEKDPVTRTGCALSAWLEREYKVTVIEGNWQTPGRASDDFAGAVE